MFTAREMGSDSRVQGAALSGKGYGPQWGGGGGSKSAAMGRLGAVVGPAAGVMVP